MIRTTLLRVSLAVVVLLTAGAPASSAAMTAQGATPPAATPPTPQDPTAPTETPSQVESRTIDDWEREFGIRYYRRPALRIGQDYALRTGETVRDVLVVFGNARVEGRVRGDLVVILGNARLGGTAVVDGSFVVVGGQATVESGALVRRDVVTIGADLDAPGDFLFAGEHVVIGTGVLGDWMRSVVPWVATGLLWGRPVVPSIGWVWSILGVFFVVYLLVNLLLHEPVRASADVLARRPFGTFMVGLLMLLLWAPISALLAVSVVGIIVIPFFLCALVVAAVVGRVSVVRWIGNTVIAPDDPDSRVLAMRSFVLGFVLLTLVYMVPVLGLVTWGLVGVFGLGASVMAFLAAWRKETPPKPPVASATPGESFAAAPFASPPSQPPPPPAPPGPPPPLASATGATPAFASFLERAAAFGMDVLLVAVLHEGLRGTVFPRHSEFFFPLLVIYFIAFWTWKATTVGGIVMKIRIVKTTGAPLEAADAIVRGLAGVLSFVTLGIGVLWILRDPEHQGWHDKAVGTWVVKDN
jgi:uncharacterized RDD family membrane protein YckC